jgi:hypothetical protein
MALFVNFYAIFSTDSKSESNSAFSDAFIQFSFAHKHFLQNQKNAVKTARKENSLLQM